MLEITQRSKAAITRNMRPEHINDVVPAFCRENVMLVNLKKTQSSPEKRKGNMPTEYQSRHSAHQIFLHDAPVRNVPHPAPQIPQIPASSQQSIHPMMIPKLERSVSRGQKTSLLLSPEKRQLRVCFGWNIKDSRCDVDASAFLLTSTGCVASDDWFVFYGNPQSPDRSVSIVNNRSADRQIIDVNLNQLNGAVESIAFVLTINEALENQLHFGMLTDVYVRILEYGTDKEIISFKPCELYASITSMTIAELYLRNGQWKFNPVGNGVNKDLAGQCAVYGVEIC